MSLRSDDLDSIVELYTEDDFRQLVVTIEATPARLGSLGEFADRGERGFVRKASLGTDRAVLSRPARCGSNASRSRHRPRGARWYRGWRGRLPQKKVVCPECPQKGGWRTKGNASTTSRPWGNFVIAQGVSTRELYPGWRRPWFLSQHRRTAPICRRPRSLRGNRMPC